MKNYLSQFIIENEGFDYNQEWLWEPKNKAGALDVKTASFSGKNQADDYTNE